MKADTDKALHKNEKEGKKIVVKNLMAGGYSTLSTGKLSKADLNDQKERRGNK